MISISEQLIKLRVEKGVTQESVAAALSISNKTVSKWENGTSFPDLEMLVCLAKYYNVSADYLLGIKDEKPTTENAMAEQFKGLNKQETVLKAYEMVNAVFPAVYDSMREEDCGNVVPEADVKGGYRNHIATGDCFAFSASSDDTNIAVALFKNRSEFKWLNEEEKREKITELFRLLSDDDALKMCYFIHSVNCSELFTAEYMSKNTGVEKEKVRVILDKFCEIGVASKDVAHLASGVSTIYHSYGDGKILTLISLAYEHMCGRPCYKYNYNGKCKMIGGKKQ